MGTRWSVFAGTQGALRGGGGGEAGEITVGRLPPKAEGGPWRGEERRRKKSMNILAGTAERRPTVFSHPDHATVLNCLHEPALVQVKLMFDATSHSAPGSAAGFIYQFERALKHLAFSENGAIVGIETMDDVEIRNENGKIVFEQDKHSIGPANPITNRSRALWKSLKIWTKELADNAIDVERAQFHLVTNNTITEGVARTLMVPLGERNDTWAIDALQKIKDAGENPTKDLKEFVGVVLGQKDSFISALLKRVLVMDATTGGDGAALVEDLKARLHLADDAAPEIVKGLRGWLDAIVMESWRDGRDAIVSRESFSAQLRFQQSVWQGGKLFREIAAEFVLVKDEDRQAHAGDRFVEQLLWVGILEDDEQLLDAIDEYLKCKTERTRLGKEGNIPPQEFRNFDERLRKRWKQIFNLHAGNRQSNEEAEMQRVGREILYNTMNHRESLADQETHEQYLTTGAYHQLANEPKDAPSVGWHPQYKSRCALH